MYVVSFGVRRAALLLLVPGVVVAADVPVVPAALLGSSTAQWGSSANLSDGTRDALGVVVADAAQAAPFAAWQEFDGMAFSIHAARYAGGTPT